VGCATAGSAGGMLRSRLRRRAIRLSVHIETATYTTQLDVKIAVLLSSMTIPSRAATPMAAMPAMMCNPRILNTNKE
jgi:hypothetical protein